MTTLHFSIFINAPREKVWHAMLDDASYREWTKPFNPGSYFEGNWEAGSAMKFLGCDDNGKPNAGGMYSMVRVNRPHEFISIEHVGMIQDGVIDTTSDMVKKWTPSFENYTFIEKDGGTEVKVDVDIVDEMKDEFNGMWPKALEILKVVAER
ncbi:MAG: SRPBCC domain-containing protein [Patescibacteria group bacterium]